MRHSLLLTHLLAACAAILVPAAYGQQQDDTPQVVLATDQGKDLASGANQTSESKELQLPPWLVPPGPTSQAGRIAAAFELEPTGQPTPETTGRPVPPLPSAKNQVRLASASRAHTGPPEVAHRASGPVSAERVHAQKLATEASSLGDLNDLIEFCSSTKHPQELKDISAWAYNRRGEYHSAAGDEHQAYDDYQRAILTDADCWQALHNRGVTLASYGRRTDALADFTRAINANPQLSTGYRNRAELLVSIGKYYEAIADFSRAIQSDPNDAELYSGRALARQQLGQTEGAVRDYNRSLALRPGNAAAFAGRGALYAELGFHEQALTDFSAALQSDPLCEPAYRSLAWLLATCHDARFRDGEKAVEAARRMLRLGDSQNPVTLDTAAAAYAAVGQYQEAVRYQQQAIALAQPASRAKFSERLTLYRQSKPFRSSER